MRARFWHEAESGRIQCDVCPRDCTLSEGQRGMCFVRQRQGDEMVLTTYGRSSGFCVDPIEKKPLAHFLPGSSVLSFGTAGCNLSCKFCQNWDISKSREMDSLADSAGPLDIARAAKRAGCASVAFTYNDPVIFLEYAMDVADACREMGVRSVAVTAGYMRNEARRAFYEKIDAANVDLKGFTEDFYRKITASELEPVKETLRYLVRETKVWTEITTLLIPGLNDGDVELGALAEFVHRELGPEVPLHFSAFHPDYKMRDIPATPPETLRRARRIAKSVGLKHVYTGNVHDREGDVTSCVTCGEAVIERDWYELIAYRLDERGRCACGSRLAGRFDGRPDAVVKNAFGRRRVRVTLNA
jgi:pyruvate formate lyase activating enzyme